MKAELVNEMDTHRCCKAMDGLGGRGDSDAWSRIDLQGNPNPGLGLVEEGRFTR